MERGNYCQEIRSRYDKYLHYPSRDFQWNHHRTKKWHLERDTPKSWLGEALSSSRSHKPRLASPWGHESPRLQIGLTLRPWLSWPLEISHGEAQVVVVDQYNSQYTLHVQTLGGGYVALLLPSTSMHHTQRSGSDSSHDPMHLLSLFLVCSPNKIAPHQLCTGIKSQ